MISSALQADSEYFLKLEGKVNRPNYEIRVHQEYAYS